MVPIEMAIPILFILNIFTWILLFNIYYIYYIVFNVQFFLVAGSTELITFQDAEAGKVSHSNTIHPTFLS